MNITQRAQHGAIGTPGVDQYTGYGIIDAVSALQRAEGLLFVCGYCSGVEVVQKGGAQAVRVHGTADANALKLNGEHFQIGSGENPANWKSIGAAQRARVRTGVLGDIPATAFQRRTCLAGLSRSGNERAAVPRVKR